MPSANAVLTEDLLRDYLAAGVFASAENREVLNAPERIGIEVEFFPVIRSQLFTSSAQPEREENHCFVGLYPWLRSLAQRQGWRNAKTEPSTALAFTLPNGGNVTLEPGGQVEYSTPPFETVEEALNDVERFESILCEDGECVGLSLELEGYNRWLGDALPQLIVRKPRYLVMDQHFEQIGPFGRQMMRQTCATQINLDFGPPEVAAKRWQLSNLIAPPLNALFANSPHTLDGVEHRSYRYEIWRRTDPSRTGTIPGLLESDPVSTYLNFALNASLMLLRTDDGGFSLPARPISFRDWMEGRGEAECGFPDIDDWECHLSTLFPHVRPRGFLEIRSVDALPAPWRRAAVILTTELLYNPLLLEAGLAICTRPNSSLNGFRPLSDYEERFRLGKRLLEIAIEETGNGALKEYYAEFTSQRAVPAERVRNKIENAEFRMQNLE